MPVFFLPSHRIVDGVVDIDDPLRSHLASSLRVRVGDIIRVGDERRMRYRVRIDHLDARTIRASILDTLSGPPPPTTSVTLAQAILKGDRMNWVIQKATELGVAAIVPILTARVVARPPASRMTAIRERWQRIATDAAEQSEQWAIPSVSPPMLLSAMLPDIPDEALRYAFIERDTTHGFRAWLPAPTFRGAIVLAVGPEGGWTDEERQSLHDQRFHAASLGDGILRSETATLAALTILQHHVGNLGKEKS